MAETFPNSPHFLEGSEQQITEFRIGDFGRELDLTGMVVKTAVDVGSSPTTTLRKGLAVGWSASDGMYIDLPNADAAVGATVGSSAAVTWADVASKTLTFKVDGEDEQTCTFGAGDDTQAEVIIAFNAVDERVQMEANGATMINIVGTAVGSEHNIQITATGTGEGTLNLDVLLHWGTDMVVGILNEQYETTHDSVTYDVGPVRLCIAGKVDSSKVYGLAGVNGAAAKRSLQATGVIFV